MLALLAPGQGSQTPGMLKPWLADSHLRKLLDSFASAIDMDLLHLGQDADADEIKDTANAQPLIVATSLLSAEALAVKNFSYVAGHSVGEISAAAIAGVISPLAAMKLVRARGVEMAQAAAQSDGGMAAVLGGDRTTVLQAIADLGLVPANDNGGGQIVAAGSRESLSQLAPDGKIYINCGNSTMDIHVINNMLFNSNFLYKHLDYLNWFDIGNTGELIKTRKSFKDSIEVLDKKDESIFFFNDFWS